MNPTVPIMVAGDMATTWRRIAVAVTIVDRMEAARVLIDPRLLPARCRPSLRMVAAVGAPVAAVAVAAMEAAVEAVGDAESFADTPYLVDGCSSTIETGSCCLHASYNNIDPRKERRKHHAKIT